MARHVFLESRCVIVIPCLRLPIRLCHRRIAVPQDLIDVIHNHGEGPDLQRLLIRSRDNHIPRPQPAPPSANESALAGHRVRSSAVPHPGWSVLSVMLPQA